MNKLNKYTVFYNTGKSEIISGTSYDHAKCKHGIYSAASENIDMYLDGDMRDKYKWNDTTRRWLAKPKLIKTI